jgi:hypothetical protein
MRPRSRGAMRPSFAFNFHPQEQEGAGKAGCALHPRSRAQIAHRKTHTSIQVQRRHPAFPAQWFTAYSALSSVSRALLPPSSAENFPANLAPASGARTTRLRRPPRCRSSRAHQRPPHPTARFVTCATPLSSGEMGRAGSADLPDRLSEIFLIRGLDAISENQK